MDDFDFNDTGVGTKKWYQEYTAVPTDFTPTNEQEIQHLKKVAENQLESEVLKYNSNAAKRHSNYQWMQTVLSKGTHSDKIAAGTILIQDSPLHNLSVISNLVNLAKPSKKKECVAVVETLTELFLTELLIPDRKLRVFEACPLSMLDELSHGDKSKKNAYLIRWYFEGQLKSLYNTFVKALETLARDTVEDNRKKAITAMFKLLIGNPEQEAFLLRVLVNKLGDPSQKVASKVIYCMNQLLLEHPNMKGVVLEEIEKLLFRVNVSSRAQYYGICLLNQFLFSEEDSTVAKNLIQLYFSFFKACTKKGEIDSRLMSVILVGVKRAYPYAKKELDHISDHVETLYKIVHVSCFNVSLHTLCLLFQLGESNSIPDRFYSALYRKMTDSQLATSSHQSLFLSLIFNAVKKDNHVGRIKAFIKRMLQMCHYLPVPLTCGVLCAVSQLLHKRDDLKAFVLEAKFMADEDSDNEEEHYEDVLLEDEKVKTNDTSLEMKPSVTPTWYHCKNVVKEESARQKRDERYDPYQRNPLFSAADHSAYIELLTLSRHYHPTVSLFASNILNENKISYSGDPLQDFTIAKFLERFVFKNPKKVNNGAVISQFDHKKNYKPVGAKKVAVTSADYLKREERSVPVDELFMFKYMNEKKLMDEKNKKDDDDISDTDSVKSDEFDDMLDDLLGMKDEDIDFAGDVSSTASNRNKNKEKQMSDEEDSDDEQEEEAEEEEEDEEMKYEGNDDQDEEFESDLELGDDDLEGFEDDEDIVFDGSESDDDLFIDTNKKKNKNFSGNSKGNLKKSKNTKFTDVFASAEEFSEILQEAGTLGKKMIGANAVSTKDKAGVKQLQWESSRTFNHNREKWKKGVKRKFKKPFQNKGNKRRKR